MIPEIKVFEEFLAGASVVSVKPSGDCSEPLHSSKTSAAGTGVDLWIEYQPGALKLDSVLRRIADGFKQVGAKCDQRVALATLGLALETKGDSGHISHVNRVLKCVKPAKVALCFVSPAPGVNPGVDIRTDYGLVAIEPFEPGRLQYWARKGGAAWPIDLNQLRGRPAMRVVPRDVTVVDIQRIPGVNRMVDRWKGRSLGVVDAYYQAIVDMEIGSVRSTFRNRMSLAEASGVAGVDWGLISQWLMGVHLVTWPAAESGAGGCWAILHTPGFTLNFPEGKTWRRASQWLLDELGVTDLGAVADSAFAAVAQSYSSLLQDARGHQAAGRVREAFLYFVIALDHLLGDDGRSVATVTERTSVLTHRMRSVAFLDEVARVKRLYDFRSRFVHDGVVVPVDALGEVDELARCVLWALTRAVVNRGHESRDAWVKSIDSIAHLLRGDPSLQIEERFSAVGARASFLAGEPPPLLRFGH